MFRNIAVFAAASLAAASCGAAEPDDAQAAGSAPTHSAQCSSSDFAVEVLGSGGPIADDGRAGAGYLVWIDRRARFLIDAGGGVFLRYGEAGAQIADHDALLISHFHADHVSDFPAIFKSGFFTKRAAPLPVAGPAGNQYFPGPSEWINAMFNSETGAYRYLSGYLTGTPRLAKLEAIEIDPGQDEAVIVSDQDGVRATAIPVNHGPVPALGFLIEHDGKSVVFGGDQSAESDFFEEFLSGKSVDLLIAHHVIPQARFGQPIGLHRSPRQIGELAATAGAKRLVLSHNMKRSLDKLDGGLKAIAENYSGPVDVAEDRSCYEVE